jgi:hypothetical protein
MTLFNCDKMIKVTLWFSGYQPLVCKTNGVILGKHRERWVRVVNLHTVKQSILDFELSSVKEADCDEIALVKQDFHTL